MRDILIIIFTLIHFSTFSQNKVTGFVRDIGGIFPGVKVSEVETENFTTSDSEGKFYLQTIRDTSTISFSFIGYETKTVRITNDTTINIILEVWHYESNWITIGLNYDAVNSNVGLLVSNGFDEHPITHFEDFSESWIYKLSGATNFKKDYSFGVKIGRDYVLRYIYMPAVEYKRIEYTSQNFSHTDINLTFGTGYRIPGSILFKTGYQKLNGNNNIGAGLGWQNSHRAPDLYYGFLVGYWTDYLTYNAFIQSFIYKHKISARVNYERIENFNLLNVGINYTFNR